MSTPELKSLQHPSGAQVQYTLFGGHVCHWRSSTGREMLYMSPTAFWDGRTALRGGVPVIFPQFAERGAGPRHGFVRTLVWEEVAPPAKGEAVGDDPLDEVFVDLALRSSEASRALWPHDFELKLRVALGAQTLRMALTVRNLGQAPLCFAAALHTYFATPTRETVVEGLSGRPFWDSTRGKQLVWPGMAKADVPSIRIDQEVDRVYLGQPQVLAPTVCLRSSAETRIGQSGFADTVLWNPWQDKDFQAPNFTPSFKDMPVDGFEHFVCVEAAQVQHPVVLQAGQSWTGEQHVADGV